MSINTAQHVDNIILKLKGSALGVAESCTGGLVASRITARPGASEVFRGGVIAYSNEVKISLLDVPVDVLRDHGAVSAQTALFMAQGVKQLLKTEMSASVTGIAGPSGGSVEKPVGTVYLAIIFNEIEYFGGFRFTGDRTEVQLQAATTLIAAIDTVLSHEIPQGFSVS